MADIRFIQ